jgi:hypothetical protein
VFGSELATPNGSLFSTPNPRGGQPPLRRAAGFRLVSLPDRELPITENSRASRISMGYRSSP